MKKLAIPLTLLATMLGAIAAQAACPCDTTFVSKKNGTASDCSPSTPCTSIATAIANTTSSGSIIITDGEFIEALTITTALHIYGVEGVTVLVSPAGGTAITVNAGPNDKLKITNLNIAGAQVGSVGIVFNSGKQLWLENVELHGFASATAIGLNFIPSSAASGGNPTGLFVRNSTIHGNSAGNVLIRPTSAVAVNAVFDHAALGGGTYGIRADNSGGSGFLHLDVTDSVATSHSNNGFLAVGTGANPVHFMIDRSTAQGNGVYGAVATGAQAFMIVSNSILASNGTGLSQQSGATVATYTNNGINFNLTNNTEGTITPIAPK